MSIRIERSEVAGPRPVQVMEYAQSSELQDALYSLLDCLPDHEVVKARAEWRRAIKEPRRPHHEYAWIHDAIVAANKVMLDREPVIA